MAINKDAIGILFGVAGGGAVNSESYNEINRGLNEIIKNINSTDPKFIKLQIDDTEFEKEIERVKGKLKEIAIGTNLKAVSTGAASSLKQVKEVTESIAESARTESKAAKDSAREINKKQKAYESAKAALQKYRDLMVELANLKSAKGIRIDENGELYTDAKRLSARVANVNKARQEMLSAISEESSSAMYKKNFASLLRRKASMDKELEGLMNHFRKTSTETEAKRVAEAEALNRQHELRREAAQSALDAMSRYRDVLREVAETGNVKFNGKEFFPVNGTEEAVKNAERLNVALGQVAQTAANQNLTEAGRKGVAESYGKEVQDLVQILDVSVKKGQEETQTISEETAKRKAANEAVKETISALMQLKSIKIGTDDIQFADGILRILNVSQLGGKAHAEELRSTVDIANEALRRLSSSIAQLGSDRSVTNGNSYFNAITNLIKEFDQEITQSAKDAEEARLIIDEVVSEYAKGLRSAKKSGIKEDYKAQIEAINNFAVGLANKYGTQYANEFLMAIETRTRERMKLLSSDYVSDRNGNLGNSEKSPEIIDDLLKLTPELNASEEERNQTLKKAALIQNENNQEIKESSALLDAQIKKEQESAAASENKRKKKKEASAAQVEETQSIKENNQVLDEQKQKETESAAALERKTAKKKEASATQAEETLKIKENNQVLDEQKQKETESAAASENKNKKKKEASINLEQENRIIEENNRLLDENNQKVKDSVNIVLSKEDYQTGSEILTDEQKLRLQWLEAQKEHLSELRAQEKADNEARKAEERQRLEEVREAERQVAEEERQRQEDNKRLLNEWYEAQKKHQQELRAQEKADNETNRAEERQRLEEAKEAERLVNEEREKALNLYARINDLEKEANKLKLRNSSAQEDYSKTFEALNTAQAEYNGLSESAREYAENTLKGRQATEDLARSMQSQLFAAEDKWFRLRNRAQEFLDDNQHAESRSAKYAKVANEMRNIIRTGTSGDWDRLNKKLQEAGDIIHRNQLEHKTWLQRFKETFGTRVRSLLSGAIIGKFTMYLRDIYKNVVEIDTAMTQLKIVTQANDEALQKYQKTATESAKRVGASISDIINSATTYARLGFTLEESGVFSEITTAYSKVADVSVDDATKNLTAIIKAYDVNANELEGVVDKLIYVGRNYAISSGEIGEGMNNAASALVANGNKIEQALGMLTAANVTPQNISRASTGLRTIAARLSASKAELDELGEDSEGVETIAKLGESFKAFGIDIQNGNGQLHTTFEILNQIAEKWSEFNDTQRSSIANLAAGTRQQDIFYSIIQNWGDAQKIVANIGESSGELAKATEDRLNSVQGKIDVLKATLEEMSTKILSSSLLKFVVDVLNFAINGISSIVDWIGGLNSVLYVTISILTILKGEMVLTAVLKTLKKVVGFVGSLKESLIAAREANISFGQFAKNAFEQATIGATNFQLVLGGIVAVLGIALLVVNKINQAREEAVRASLEQASAAMQEAEAEAENVKTLDELIKKYKELAENNNSTWDNETINSVKSIQADIVKLIGDQAQGIDLVNGKLEDEYALLEGIVQKNGEYAKEKYREALEDARVALLLKTNGDSGFFGNTYEVDKDEEYREWFRQTANQYGIKTREHNYYGTQGGYGGSAPYIDFEFTDADEFVKQYEAVAKLKSDLAQEGKGMEDAYHELSLFLKDFEEVYKAYIAAKRLYDSFDIVEADKREDDDKNGITGVQVELKKLLQILEETQGGFDGLSNILNEVPEGGYLTADMLSSLAKLEEENKLGGLKLSDILSKDANGYKIANDALEQYIDTLIQAQIAQYSSIEAFASLQDQQNAIENINNYILVLKTLIKTQDKATSSTDKQKDALNKQKEGLQDQLNAYKELIDLRKDLLKQYKDELDYKRELEKKEQKLSSLQTQYAISQLDTSAAGRAKTRQLAEDLKEAQEDLDDFTLDHAIDVVTGELDEQYDEYKRFIDDKLDSVESRIDALTQSNSSNSSSISESMATMAAELAEKLSELKASVEKIPVAENSTSEPNRRWTSYADAAKGGFGNILTESEWAARKAANAKGLAGYKTYQDYLDAMQTKYIAAQHYVDSHGFREGDKARWGQDPNFRPLLRDLIEAGGSLDNLKGAVETSLIPYPFEKHHTGGIVGSVAQLKSTETFAKLLKGEFVATPKMMERFINQTLPNIAAHNAPNEFNAPLVSIQCENVTQESLPRLKEIVDDAVKEIKRQFEGGLSRAGYKPAIKSTAK